MSDRIDEIEQRLQAATPGPWLHLEGEPLQAITPGFDSEGRLVFISGHGWADDAEFIAHAPSDISWLLARVRELEAEKADAWSEGWGAGFREEPPHNPYRLLPSTDSEAKQ